MKFKQTLFSSRMSNMTSHFTFLSLLILFLSSAITSYAQDKPTTIESKLSKTEKKEGYFNYYWDDASGKIFLEIDKLDTEILYVNSLAAGVGSNDIGLDRGQLGDIRVVKFVKTGPKILLVQPNYDYRAMSDNASERASVEEAFAQSVLWGFKVEKSESGKVIVDATSFLLRDAHGVTQRLARNKQGAYKLDKSRSAIYLPMCKNFPKNTEFEATLTFVGQAKGDWIRSVTPSSDAVSVRLHHSFIELPDNKYEARLYDPRAGFNATSFQDYASPIGSPLTKRLIERHRLEKKNPSAKLSEAVEPIVYYVDRGAPEPVKSALIEGASWWNQAFEAAGYKDAFQVKEMPDHVDPLDVRYNVIQWVHRSTRGWSYGASVTDPRTGEIIKGHVSLGSLRVRQDFLIAQGLLQPYEDGTTPDPRLLEMALARLRQLSAHEVGHTIGLAHNFAASVNNRSSVMDYPHPYITLNDKGEVDFSDAYAVGIGDWDKRTILYGYQDFPKGTQEATALQNILTDNITQGYHFISDSDARPQGGAQAFGHLWDNGASPIEELKRISVLRAKAMAQFSEKNIPMGAPMASLENVFVPVYLAHRYQVEAAAKLIGGVEYTYAMRGDGQLTNKVVASNTQRAALDALLATISSEFLAIPEHVIDLIPPQPMGYRRGRELFKTHTAMIFDPLGAAEAAAANSLTFLLHPTRLARIVEQSARGKIDFTLNDYLSKIHASIIQSPKKDKYAKEIAVLVEKLYLNHLFQLASNKKAMQQVSATALYQLDDIESGGNLGGISPEHQKYIVFKIAEFKRRPEAFEPTTAPKMPDGSPIGCGHLH